MNEREVLELMRRVIECGDVVGRLGMLNEIDRRLAALPSAAQEKPDPTRCYVCGWPLAASRKQGCVAGDCSYRPLQGTPEHDRIKDRLRAQMSAPSAAPSHALVEAADAMRDTLFRVGSVLPSDVEEIKNRIAAYDLARSSLPAATKDGGA